MDISTHGFQYTKPNSNLIVDAINIRKTYRDVVSEWSWEWKGFLVVCLGGVWRDVRNQNGKDIVALLEGGIPYLWMTLNPVELQWLTMRYVRSTRLRLFGFICKLSLPAWPFWSSRESRSPRRMIRGDLIELLLANDVINALLMISMSDIHLYQQKSCFVDENHLGVDAWTRDLFGLF